MIPSKDPNNLSLIAYLAFGFLSMWGGISAYLLVIQQSGRQFRWGEAFIQIVVSGFAGTLSMLFCWYINAPMALSGFIAGISGFMGTKAIELWERKASDIIGGGRP